MELLTSLIPVIGSFIKLCLTYWTIANVILSALGLPTLPDSAINQ